MDKNQFYDQTEFSDDRLKTSLEDADEERIYDPGEENFYELDQRILNSGDKTAITQLLLRKTKICTANYLKDDCIRNKENILKGFPPNLVITEVLDVLLKPGLNINNSDTISWLKHLIAGGTHPKEFYKQVEEYDNPTTCSLVWTADFMAYRCRTCGVSPCMSLCLECFYGSDHAGHDYNMFKSQAGGACDCGNKAVMEPSGFCCKHNGSKIVLNTEPPEEMLLLPRIIMARLFQRFILYCRMHGNADFVIVQKVMKDAEPYIEFLQELCCCGAPMRTIMADVFCDPKIYKTCTEPVPGNIYYDEMSAGEAIYLEALQSIEVGDAPEGFEDITSLHGPLSHNTFIEEFMFWNVKFEFPQKLVCLMLNMRPDSRYEDAFARAFVQHYSRIAVMLVQSIDTDTLSHRVVHVSVQLFSDNSLAYRMTDSYHLLHVMILSLKKMMQGICKPSTLHDHINNRHMVVNCSHRVMKNHCYWPLVSDLNNILSFKNIAEILLGDDRLLHEWISFLIMFQGMNNNIRIMRDHVDYEPHTYYAAFSAELEASASPLWALISHLKDESTSHYSVAILQQCLIVLERWFKEIGFGQPERVHYEEVSFHFPLHRNYSLILRQAVKQGMKLKDVLPSTSMLSMLLVHPMRIQVAFHEIMSDKWIRNGLQMKGQAMTYIQSHFCNSLVDPDLFLIQIGAGEMPKDSFLLSIFERFHALDELTFTTSNPQEVLSEQKLSNTLESILYFIAVITTNRNSIGLDQREIVTKEMMSLLCFSDKTHSQIMEQIPEKCLGSSSINLEEILKEVTNYCQPTCADSGTMKQGTYVPKAHVWEDLFDPIFVQLRALSKRDFSATLTRYRQFVKDSNKFDRKECSRLWPPYRLPSPVSSSFVDPRRILACRTFHAIIFVLLYKCLKNPSLNENLLGFTIYLLELTIDYQFTIAQQDNGRQLADKGTSSYESEMNIECPDGLFYLWFSSDDVFVNAVARIDRIQLKSPINIRTASEESVNDYEMIEIEGVDPMLPIAASNSQSVRSIVSGSELVPYSVDAAAVVPLESTVEYSNNLRRADVPLISDTQYPSLLAGSEVALRHSNGVLQQPNTFYNTRPRRLTGAAACPTGIGEGEVDSTVIQYLSDASNSKALVESATAGNSQALNLSKYSVTSPSDSGEQYMTIGETLISLLLKLHTKLSGINGSHVPNFEPDERDCRIGDGLFFLSKVLNKLGRCSSEVKTAIIDTRQQLYPRETNQIPSHEDPVCGDRKSKADESRRRAMAFFKKKRAVFLKREKLKKLVKETQHETSGDEEMIVEEADTDFSSDTIPQPTLVTPVVDKSHECAICFTKDIPSRTSNLIGYVGLLTPTNIVGHRLHSPTSHKLPLCESDFIDLRQNRKTLGKFMENRWRQINLHFVPHSSFNVLDKGWHENVHVQVCGHTVHMTCLQQYIDSLWQERTPRNQTDFHCPMCRKSSNALIPIAPFIEEQMDVPLSDLVNEIDHELAHVVAPDYGECYNVKADTLMNLLAVPTPFNYEECLSSPLVFQFFSAVLRNNVEDLLVLYNGSLINYEDMSVSQKRSAIVPLKCCLSHQAKSLLTRRDIDIGGTHWIRELWSSLTERSIMDYKGALVAKDQQVPMLFRDPITLLLHLFIHTRVEQYPGFLNCIIRHVYRLVVVQATASILVPLSEQQRLTVATEGPLAPLFAMVSNQLRECVNHLKDFRNRMKQLPSFENWSLNEFTCEVREQCLTFLRIASLLKSQLSEMSLPTIVDPLSEHGALEQYLGVWETCSVVNTSAMGKMCGSVVPADFIPPPLAESSSSFVVSPSGIPVETHLGDLSGVCKMWCAQLCGFAYRAPSSTILLMLSDKFYTPRLLSLPSTYEELFSFYHMRKCSQCGNPPKEVSVCLICGECVCLKRPCWSGRRDVFGCSKHAKLCGNGTGLFLSVTQTSIYICRGSRIAVWGCIHLDSYGEEDRDLKRGKPLFLSTRRYKLLEHQWITHSFDHNVYKWFYPNPNQNP